MVGVQWGCMERRNFLKAIGVGSAITAVSSGSAMGQFGPVSGGGGGGEPRDAPVKIDSDVGVSISPYIVDENDVSGFTSHVDPNDNTRLIISGDALLQSDHRELEVYDVEIDDEAKTVDVTLQFWKTDEANSNAVPGVGVRGGNPNRIQDGGDTRYMYKAHGFIEFDRDVSEYDFDV